MNILRLLLLPAFCLLAMSHSVDVYSAADLASLSATLAAKNTAYADRDLARFSNHYFLLIRRNQTGSAELHKKEADVIIGESGAAIILVGGTIANPRATKAGEIRGSSIEGGERHHITAGDIVHIPAGTPHQFLLEKGHPFSYFVVKITGQ